jgi:hypothetical protein
VFSSVPLRKTTAFRPEKNNRHDLAATGNQVPAFHLPDRETLARKSLLTTALRSGLKAMPFDFAQA